MATRNGRVKSRDRLPLIKGNRLVCVARLVGQIQNIVGESGSPEDFDAIAWMSRWLNEPLPALGGVRPLDLLDTTDGEVLVSNTLAQTQSGAYA